MGIQISFATHDDVCDVIIIHAYTAAKHDAIIIVSSCYWSLQSIKVYALPTKKKKKNNPILLPTGL